MVYAGFGGCKQCKDKIDGLTIHGIKIQRRVQTQECPDHAVKAFDTRVGQCNALADTRRAKALAFLKRVDGPVQGESVTGRSNLSKILEKSLFTRQFSHDFDRLWVQKLR